MYDMKVSEVPVAELLAAGIDPRLSDRGYSPARRRQLAELAELIPADHPNLWKDSALDNAVNQHLAWKAARLRAVRDRHRMERDRVAASFLAIPETGLRSDR